jgi:predicted nucleotidyltransferase
VEITQKVMISMRDRDASPRHARRTDGVGRLGYLQPMTDETLIAEATRRLSEAAPDARVILFGSRARGEAREGSDLDLLVIEPDLESRRAEFVRLREALGDLGVPIDLVIVSADYAERRAEVRGSMVAEALERGRVLVGA